MLLAASSAALKAKLSEKARWRPSKMVRRKMPDGHEQLAELPKLRAGAPPGDPDAVAEYAAAIDGLRRAETGVHHRRRAPHVYADVRGVARRVQLRQLLQGRANS